MPGLSLMDSMHNKDEEQAFPPVRAPFLLSNKSATSDIREGTPYLTSPAPSPSPSLDFICYAEDFLPWKEQGSRLSVYSKFKIDTGYRKTLSIICKPCFVTLRMFFTPKPTGADTFQTHCDF